MIHFFCFIFHWNVCSTINGLDSKYWNGMWIISFRWLCTYLSWSLLHIFWFENSIFHTTSYWHSLLTLIIGIKNKMSSLNGTAYIAQQSFRGFTQSCNQIRTYVLEHAWFGFHKYCHYLWIRGNLSKNGYIF